MAGAANSRASGFAFTEVSVGAMAACALTADGAVLCWGRSDEGTDPNDTPENPAPSIRFSSFEVSNFGRCGVALSGTAYCLGDGTATVLSGQRGT